MLIDLKALKFQELYGIGYLDGDPEKNTPNLTIGTCAKL
jgi:hypothetical protein